MKKIFIMISLFAVVGCSHSNVGNKWDCPVTKGYPCINISQADELATSKLLKDRDIKKKVKEEGDGKVKGLAGRVWFNSYTDSSGNVHEASVVNYVE